VTSLVAGAYYNCVVLADHHLKCWGYNNVGQLGLEDTAHRGDAPGEMGASLPTVHVPQSVAVATHNAFACALLDPHQVRCWGANTYGQLGIGDTINRGGTAGDLGPLPDLDLQPSGTVTHLAVGNNHACAVLGGRTIKCWGYNYEGELGLGDTVARGDQPAELGSALPTVALGVDEPVRAILLGGAHGCVLFDNDGGLRCWGYNVHGQLGLGDADHRGDDSNEMGLRLFAPDLGTP
jgi:alpha-tubulin suppressor-like RCC1 family protein